MEVLTYIGASVGCIVGLGISSFMLAAAWEMYNDVKRGRKEYKNARR